MKRTCVLLGGLAAATVMLVWLLLLPAAAAAADWAPEHEPNNVQQQANQLTPNVAAVGSLEPDTDMDWYYLDIPYAATVHIEMDPAQPNTNTEPAIAYGSSGSLVYPGASWPVQFVDEERYTRTGTVTGPCRLYLIVSLVGGAQPGREDLYYLKVWFEEGEGFPDVPDWHPFYTPIMELAERGVVTGYASGNFGPDDNVLRAQFAKMIIRSLSYYVDESMDPPFWDLGADNLSDLYPHEYVAVAADKGITMGTGVGTFSPWNNITLAQVVTMCTRAGEQEYKIIPIVPAGYTPPFPNFGAPHYEYARKAAYSGMFQGYYGPWNWWEPATRGQCAFFIWRLALMTPLE